LEARPPEIFFGGAIHGELNVIALVNDRSPLSGRETMTDQEVRVLNDPEILRLIADPLRLRLLEALRREPRTVTELARELGVARTRLYYHVRLLEEHGLVDVAETHLVQGITEKRYRVTAYRLSVDRSLLGGNGDGSRPLDVLLSVILDEVAGEIRRSVASGLIDLTGDTDQIAPDRMGLGRNWYRLSDAEVAELSASYEVFLKSIASRQVELDGGNQGAGADPPLPSLREDALTDDPEQPRRLYEWLVGFYPVVPPADRSGAPGADSEASMEAAAADRARRQSEGGAG
jgi:DNA-binding transcriptional ArsR family regulator